MHICINKGTVTLVKGDLGLYLENFVLGQIVPVLAILSDLDTYQCTPNEVKLTVPIYDLSTRDFHGLKWIFAYIILRDDDDEVFLRTVLIKKNYLLDSYSKIIFDIEGYWESERQDSQYRFTFPRLKHTVKWKYDYIINEEENF